MQYISPAPPSSAVPLPPPELLHSRSRWIPSEGARPNSLELASTLGYLQVYQFSYFILFIYLFILDPLSFGCLSVNKEKTRQDKTTRVFGTSLTSSEVPIIKRYLESSHICPRRRLARPSYERACQGGMWLLSHLVRCCPSLLGDSMGPIRR
jgi:hypothetical protein